MIRESVPHFDLYAELEVSSGASVEAIEAAHRALVKRFHPDLAAARATPPGAGVATPIDEADDAAERIKRINVARDWLTDPALRRRYDSAVRFKSAIGATAKARGGAAGATSGYATGGYRYTTEAGTGRGAWTASWQPQARTRSGFGINTDEVRAFLAELRELDEDRAARIREGVAVAEKAGYAEARRLAFTTARARRLSEWLFAREAASVIVRRKFGETRLARAIEDPLVDYAGAIAVRDLLPPSSIDLLTMPWTWRGDRFIERGSGAPAQGRPTFWPNGGPALRVRPRPSQPLEPSMPPTSDTAATGPIPKPRTEPRPQPQPVAPRDYRRPAIAGLAISSVVLLSVLGLTALGGSGLLGGAANATTAALGPVVTPAPVPSLVAVAPTIAPTSTPVPPPSAAPTPAIPPAQLAALQKSAWTAIQNLAYAASIGDVATAQAYLGGTAPGLLPSGLKHASFPSVGASAIKVTKSGSGWRATAGSDHLTSSDGKHWTFDYANRPLVRFAGTQEHDVYFLQPLGRRDIVIKLTSVSITRTSVLVGVSWTYGADPAHSTDGWYFAGDPIAISSLTVGSQTIDAATFATLSGAPGSLTVRVPTTIGVAFSVTVGISVQNGGGNVSPKSFGTLTTTFSVD